MMKRPVKMIIGIEEGLRSLMLKKIELLLEQLRRGTYIFKDKKLKSYTASTKTIQRLLNKQALLVKLSS